MLKVRNTVKDVNSPELINVYFILGSIPCCPREFLMFVDFGLLLEYLHEVIPREKLEYYQYLPKLDTERLNVFVFYEPYEY